MLFKNTLLKHYPPGRLTTMLATSKNVIFSGHYDLLTTDADDPTLWLLPACWHSGINHSVGYSAPVGIAGDSDLEIGPFQKWLAWRLTGG